MTLDGAAFTDLTTPDVAALAKVSNRQIDHWVRLGYLLDPAVARTGSGVKRLWSREEAVVAVAMGRLVCAGITPAAAAPVARRVATAKMTDRYPRAVVCALGEGVRVEVTLDDLETSP